MNQNNDNDPHRHNVAADNDDDDDDDDCINNDDSYDDTNKYESINNETKSSSKIMKRLFASTTTTTTATSASNSTGRYKKGDDDDDEEEEDIEMKEIVVLGQQRVLPLEHPQLPQAAAAAAAAAAGAGANYDDDDQEPIVESGAVIAAAADDDDDDDDVEEKAKVAVDLLAVDGPSNPQLLSLLLDELRMIANISSSSSNSNSHSNNGTNFEDAINYEKAQNILEATAGDVYTAAQLYWDDYLASIQHNNTDNLPKQLQDEVVQQQPLPQRRRRPLSPMIPPEQNKNDDKKGFDENGTNHPRHYGAFGRQYHFSTSSTSTNNSNNNNPDALVHSRRLLRRLMHNHHNNNNNDPMLGGNDNQDHNNNNDNNIDINHEPQQQPYVIVPPPEVQRPPHAGSSRQQQGRSVFDLESVFDLNIPPALYNNNDPNNNVGDEAEEEDGFDVEVDTNNGPPLQDSDLVNVNNNEDVLLPYRNENNNDNIDESNVNWRRRNVFESLLQNESQQHEPNNFSNNSNNRRRDNDFLRFLSYGDDTLSVSDEDMDDDGEIIVRRRRRQQQQQSTRDGIGDHRLLQFLKDNHLLSSTNNDTAAMEESIMSSVKRRKLNNHSSSKKGINHDNDDDSDNYVSDNDWMWDSFSNISSTVPEQPPLSFPMEIVWGRSTTTTSDEAGSNNNTTNNTIDSTGNDTTKSVPLKGILKGNVTNDDGTTKKVIKVSARLLHQQRRGEFKLLSEADKKKIRDKVQSLSEKTMKSIPTIEHDSSEDDDDDDDGDDDHNNVEDAIAGIPRTWMNAGFHLVKIKSKGPQPENHIAKSTVGIHREEPFTNASTTNVVGLALPPPNDSDFAYTMWKNQQSENNDTQHASILLPYHCRSITALLSIVTGLMYTGVSVQNGNHVSCMSSRPPLQELIAQENMKKDTKPKGKMTKGELMYQQLSETDRLGREYDTRLVDALTALLHVSAEASMKRKERALQVLQLSKDPTDQRRWLRIKRKLRLVPTCTWEMSPSEVRLEQTDMPKDDMICSLPIIVSYTNIEDLRSYVLSNIRAFTSTGGCALLIETIARIHGKGALVHMIRRSRKAAGYTGSDVSIPLLHCTCNQRHRKALDDDPILVKDLKAQSKKGILYDTTPLNHSCMSIELVSLLLVGRVHSTLRGWSTGPLGLGLLTNKMNEVGRGLTRPEKPVWILRGPTCYSVMWLNGCSDRINTFARKDSPGDVASITHWNCWYNQRNATQIRLVTDRTSLQQHKQQQQDTDMVYEFADESTTSDSVKMLAQRRCLDEYLSRECKRVEMIDSSLAVSDDELQQIRVHPDDPKFYPNKYKMWRYAMGEDTRNDCKDNDETIDSSKYHAKNVPQWKSYYSLSDHERHVIETKYGPKIVPILWTRWPRSTMDQILPITSSGTSNTNNTNEAPPIV